MNAMKYKGYYAKIEFDPEDNIFVGQIIGLVDTIVFHGESVSELETAFHESIDDYLAACKKLGQPPNKPYSGRITLRLSPEIHAAVVAAAEASNSSVNRWASNVLKNASHPS